MSASQKILQFITEELLEQEQPVGEDEDLLRSGLLDSMAIGQLVLFIEEEFSISVPPTDLRIENFQTVNKISAYLAGASPAE